MPGKASPTAALDGDIRDGRHVMQVRVFYEDTDFSGVVYHASWIDPAAARCFQIMEADSVEPLEQWASRWADLADFEIVPVLTSQDYWAAQETGKNRSG